MLGWRTPWLLRPHAALRRATRWLWWPLRLPGHCLLPRPDRLIEVDRLDVGLLEDLLIVSSPLLELLLRVPSPMTSVRAASLVTLLVVATITISTSLAAGTSLVTLLVVPPTFLSRAPASTP